VAYCIEPPIGSGRTAPGKQGTCGENSRHQLGIITVTLPEADPSLNAIIGMVSLMTSEM
jgi:hypothetical protein